MISDNDYLYEPRMTDKERLARLEGMFLVMVEQNKLLIEKVDELLEFKHKSTGAFILIATLASTGVLGIGSFVIGLFRGH